MTKQGVRFRKKKRYICMEPYRSRRDLIKLMEWLHLGINWEVYVVDRDPVKQKNGLCGCEVLSPEAFFNREKKECTCCDLHIVCCRKGDQGTAKGPSGRGYPCIFPYDIFI